MSKNPIFILIKVPLTLERKQRIPLQAERTATFLLHRYGLEKAEVQEQEMAQLSLRAKYELKRIPEIRRKLIKEWDREGNFDEDKDGIFAHMIADRLASIEGRLYLEAKQRGLNPPSNIEELAQKEIETHRQQTKELAAEIFQKYFLSEKASLECAKNVLRYKETHGEKPSKDQISHIILVEKTLEKNEARYVAQGFKPHEIAFLKRTEADRLFRSLEHTKISNEMKPSNEIEQSHTRARASLNRAVSQIEQDISRLHQKGLSL